MTERASHVRSILSQHALDSLFEYLTSQDIRVARTSQFVFLCGKRLDDPASARRILLDYGRRHIKSCRFFLAEDAIAALKESGTTPDLLTIENYLADYADAIVIILESDGAKVELGAFAHQEALSKKTLVINHARFVDSESFIADGPLRKLDQESALGATIYVRFDRIARVHDQVAERLGSATPRQRTRLSFDDYKTLTTNLTGKQRALLVSDLVGLLGPVTHAELVDLLEEALGEGEYDFLKVDRSILRSLGFLQEDVQHQGNRYLVTTKGTSPFCEYDSGDLFQLRSEILLSYRKRDRPRFDLLSSRMEMT